MYSQIDVIIMSTGYSNVLFSVHTSRLRAPCAQYPVSILYMCVYVCMIGTSIIDSLFVVCVGLYKFAQAERNLLMQLIYF